MSSNQRTYISPKIQQKVRCIRLLSSGSESKFATKRQADTVSDTGEILAKWGRGFNEISKAKHINVM
jgi:hypothetical protein